MDQIELSNGRLSITSHWLVFSVAWIACHSLVAQDAAEPLGEHRAGQKIYAKQCARCHGDQGQGVAGHFDHPFKGTRSVEELAVLIDETMPEDDPDLCIDADAAHVAAYIKATFLSPTAVAEPRIELVHLTVPQYENAIADIAAGLLDHKAPGDERGLKAAYYDSKDTPKEKLLVERVESIPNGDLLPLDPFKDKAGEEGFHVRWEGSLFAEETGPYQFGVHSPNGYRLFVNDLSEPLIDRWVATPSEPEASATLKLLGGRWYSIRLECFKFKEPEFSIRLTWQRPRRLPAPIDLSYLAPRYVQPVLVTQTVFPADDSSVGYPRGTLVSKEWDAATTEGAVEIAELVSQRLPAFVGRGKKDGDLFEDARHLCRAVAERAFRRSLPEEWQQRYVDQFFESDESPASASKKSLIAILKSPWFLYDGLPTDQTPSERVAQRLAFSLWDSLPDAELRKAAKEKRLTDPEAIRSIAQTMIERPATRAKLREFVVRWLRLESTTELSKDPAVFAEFDKVVIDDLQESLLRFVDDCIWETDDFRQLLLADYLWLNPRLQDFYQIPGESAPGERFAKVSVDPSQRAGLLTHPLLLSQLAYYRTTSPIHRGVFVSRNLLGIQLNPPPIAVEPLGEDFDPAMTTRQRVEFQTRPDNCMSCHRVINPLGFALENLDAVGRIRERENEQQVDTHVLVQTSDEPAIELDGPRKLAEYLADSWQTQRHFVETLFHHLIKQPVAAFGDNELDRLTRHFVDSQFSIRELMLEIAVTAAVHELPLPADP